MKVKIIDINKSLIEKVQKALIPPLSLYDIEIIQGDIFQHEGIIVSASNPNFTMGAGLDALIKQKYPKECESLVPHKNQRVGNIIFTITVGKDLKATRELVTDAIKFALDSTEKDETLLISGLGTGIGGLDEDVFVEILIKCLTEKLVRYKFMRDGLKSEHGDIKWEIGKWVNVEGKIRACENGLHCSKMPLDALVYVRGNVIAYIEGAGDYDFSQSDKDVYRYMKILKAYRWNKKDSVSLAIFAAEKVLYLYERKYTNDKRPRKAIEAAERYLKTGNANANANANAAAYAADAAANAAAYAAANAAAYAADAAANAAAYAADAAANAAAYAAYNAAAYAAYDAYDAYDAREKLKKEINSWMIERIATLEEYKNEH